MGKTLSSSKLPFPNLSIQGFRGFRNFEVSSLGRVTLITGQNNTGKSSILEALRLLAQNAASDTLYDILTSRGEQVSSRAEESEVPDPEKAFFFSTLFYGFPSIHDRFEAIVLKSDAPSQPMMLSLEVEWLVERQEGNRRTREVISREELLREDIPREPYLTVRTEGDSYTMPFATLRHYKARLGQSSGRARMQCQFIDACGRSESLGRLWDEAILRGEEDEAVKALQIIEPSITAVRMLGGDGAIRSRRVFVRTHNFARLVPLRAFGDGLNRLFTIILTLLQARKGLLLIDEFENGLHHTVQLDTWHIIFQLARELDIQVFATTYSWDAVQSFQEAATENSGVGVLLRLFRRDDDIIPTVVSEEQLAIATRSEIEVR